MQDLSKMDHRGSNRFMAVAMQACARVHARTQLCWTREGL